MKRLLFIIPLLFCLNAWGAGCDDDTVLLLHNDGTDGSTTFTDENCNGNGAKSVSAQGDTEIDTAQKKFGTASALFDGTDDYLQVTDDDEFAFGTSDFTIDIWLRSTAVNGSDNLYSQVGTWATDFFYWRTGYIFGRSGGTNFAAYDIGTVYVTYFTANTWHHLALQRNGSNFELYIDGTKRTISGTSPGSTSYPNFSGNVTIGVNLEGANKADDLDGWLDEYRISDIKRYSANFTPETEAYSKTTTRNRKIQLSGEYFSDVGQVITRSFVKNKDGDGYYKMYKNFTHSGVDWRSVRG